MAQNDNIRDGFNELLGGIDKDLKAQKGASAAPGADDSKGKAYAGADKTDENKIEDGGTRVFDTVKPEVQEKDLSDFEAEAYTAKPASSVKAQRKPVYRIPEKSAPSGGTANSGKTHVFGAVTAKQNAGNVQAGSPVQKRENRTSGNNKGVHRENTEMKKNSSSMTAGAKKASGKKKKGGLFGSVAKFVLYIVFVLGASVLCSAIIINVANDMFAFVKSEQVSEISIPENASTKDIARILDENDIIEYPFIFRLYTEIELNRLRISRVNRDKHRKGKVIVFRRHCGVKEKFPLPFRIYLIRV